MADTRYRFERLTKHHSKGKFYCGVESLDRYFHEQVGQDLRRNMTVPYVLVDSIPDVVAGYYTLSSLSIVPASLPDDVTRKLPSYRSGYPAILIGRLAVDANYHNQGFGALLLIDALKKALESSEIAGAYAVVVDAENEKAVGFYEHFGFLHILDDEGRLYLPIDTIKRLEL